MYYTKAEKIANIQAEIKGLHEDMKKVKSDITHSSSFINSSVFTSSGQKTISIKHRPAVAYKDQECANHWTRYRPAH